MKHTDEQLDLMEWKMDNVEKQMVEPMDNQDVCIVNLLKSVSEVLKFFTHTETIIIIKTYQKAILIYQIAELM